MTKTKSFAKVNATTAKTVCFFDESKKERLFAPDFMRPTLSIGTETDSDFPKPKPGPKSWV